MRRCERVDVWLECRMGPALVWIQSATEFFKRLSWCYGFKFACFFKKLANFGQKLCDWVRMGPALVWIQSGTDFFKRLNWCYGFKFVRFFKTFASFCQKWCDWVRRLPKKRRPSTDQAWAKHRPSWAKQGTFRAKHVFAPALRLGKTNTPRPSNWPKYPLYNIRECEGGGGRARFEPRGPGGLSGPPLCDPRILPTGPLLEYRILPS